MKNKTKNHRDNYKTHAKNPHNPKKGAGRRTKRDHETQKKHIRPSLYGMHAVREAFLNRDRDVKALYLSESAQQSFEEVLTRATRAGLTRPNPTIVDKQELERLLPKGAVHQGIALACSQEDECDVQDLIIKAAQKDRMSLVILDQVTDPHNVGAILRSASAFGLDGVIMQKKHAPELSGVLAKTACGAVDHIAVAKATNLARAIEDLQQEGFCVIGLDERGEDIATIDLPKKVVLVLGAEGPGLRRLVKDRCDSLAKLPTGGAIASLNVSNAAAVAFYAISQVK